MEYVNLGNTDIKVSRICLGCMSFGEASKGMHSWVLPYDESKKIIKYALDNGINFFDTAMSYQGGTSEIYLGKAIKELTNREDVVIASKYMPRTLQQIEEGISAREHLEKCLNDSLERLDMEYIDLYIMHKWDNYTPIEETMEILNSFIEQGKIKAIGVSNCFAWQIALANEIAKQHGWATFQTIQGHYNLIYREEEREMKPYCNLNNISLTPYSSLASGRLSRRIGETSKRLKEDNYARGKYEVMENEDLKIITRVQELADKKNCSMSEISLAWLLTKVASPIIGATKLKHIEAACLSLNVKLTDDEINYLEENYVSHPLVGVMKENN